MMFKEQFAFRITAAQVARHHTRVRVPSGLLLV